MTKAEIEAVFIDRDGTVGPDDVENPFDFSPFEFSIGAIELLKTNSIPVYMFTNQACIARNRSYGFDFYGETEKLRMDGIFLCPHDDIDNCSCRKPKPGLLLRAREELGIDLSKCFVIGDRWSDMAAGGICGCKLILVLTGRGGDAMAGDRKLWADYSPSYIAKDLMDAAEWIISSPTF